MGVLDTEIMVEMFGMDEISKVKEKNKGLKTRIDENPHTFWERKGKTFEKERR